MVDQTYTIMVTVSDSVNAAAAQILYATAPPTQTVAGEPSGLVAVSPNIINGTPADMANIQAMLTYVDVQWGGGVVHLPSRVIRSLGAGLNIPTGVQLRGGGQNQTVLDFSDAAPTIVALTGSHPNGRPIKGLSLRGPNTGDKNLYPTNTSTGISFSGTGITVEDVGITRFFYGVDLTNPNSFFFTGIDLNIGYAGVCVDANNSATHNGGTIPGENGERHNLISCTLYNSQVGLDMDGSGLSIMATGCSFDYLGLHAKIINSYLFMENCHLETGYAVGTNNWGSMQRHMFQMQYEARLFATNCRFEVREAGVYGAITPFTGPAVYNSGVVRWSNCSWFGVVGTQSGRTYQSEDMVSFPAGSATTLTAYSPFGSKWSPVTVALAANDTTPQRAGYGVAISGIAVSSVGGTEPAHSVTITRTPPTGVAAPFLQMWLKIDY